MRAFLKYFLLFLSPLIIIAIYGLNNYELLSFDMVIWLLLLSGAISLIIIIVSFLLILKYYFINGYKRPYFSMVMLVFNLGYLSFIFYMIQALAGF